MTVSGASRHVTPGRPNATFVVAETVRDGFAAIGIVEAATGKVVAFLDIKPGEQVLARAVVWATRTRSSPPSTGELIVFSTEGKELRRISLPSALRGVQNDLSFARS